MFAAEAKKRQKEHGKTAPGKKKTLTAKLREVSGEASEQAGKAFGVDLCKLAHNEHGSNTRPRGTKAPRCAAT